MVLSPDLKVTSANHAFYELFNLKLEDVESRLIYEISNGQWNISGLRSVLEGVLDKDAQFEHSIIEQDFTNTDIHKILVNARRIRQAGIRTDMILLTIMNATGEM